MLKWGDRSSVGIAVVEYIWKLIELYSFSSESIVGDVDVNLFDSGRLESRVEGVGSSGVSHS